VCSSDLNVIDVKDVAGKQTYVQWKSGSPEIGVAVEEPSNAVRATTG
jgi:hypothetical protein